MYSPDSPKPKPAYDLTFEERPGYLLARVSGPEDSLEVSLSFWQAIYEETQRRRTTHLLVWEDFPNNVGPLDIVRVGTFLAELGLNAINVAFVDEHLDQLDRNRFGETVANSQGLRCRVFGDFEEGEEWLLGG